MDRAVRNLVELGPSIGDAIDAATRVPADLIGRPDLGRLTSRCTADVVVLDDSLEVTRTLVGGQEVFARA
jgi:N-acetylglucosamine-6-phosphate deacetylase